MSLLQKDVKDPDILLACRRIVYHHKIATWALALMDGENERRVTSDLREHTLLFVLRQKLKSVQESAMFEMLDAYPLNEESEEEKKTKESQKVVYVGYTILHDVVAVMLDPSLHTDENVSNLCRKVLDKLLSVPSVAVRVEVAEDLFALLFLRSKDAPTSVARSRSGSSSANAPSSTDLTDQDVFICSPKLFKRILVTINDFIEATLRNASLSTDSVLLR